MADEGISDNNIAAIGTGFCKDPDRHQLPQKQLTGNPRGFSALRRLRSALLAWRDMVMCPRVGTLVIGLMGGTALAVLSFFFQVCQTNRPAPEAKKFASLSKAAGFQRAESFGRPRKGETP